MSVRSSLRAALGALLTAPALLAGIVDPFFAGSTAVALGNDDSVLVDLGFTYHTPNSFNQSQVWINSNGSISLGTPMPDASFSIGSCCGGTITVNVTDPSTIQQSALGDEAEVFMPFGADLDPSLGGSVRIGNPVPNVFVASWIDVPFHADPALTNTFQIVLIGPNSSFQTTNGVAIPSYSILFGYSDLGASPDGAAGVALAGSYGDYLVTLNSLGIGDANGMVGNGDFANLVAADPILFNGLTSPMVVGPIEGLATGPEPGSFALLGLGLVGMAVVLRRRAFSANCSGSTSHW